MIFQAIILTPREYGLKVKNHDESLIITARNKMFNSSDATVSINYYGELIETRKITNNDKKIQANLSTLKRFVLALPDSKRDKDETKNFLWKNISINIVLDFIKSYENHPLNIKTDSSTIEKYLISQNITSFDVAVISNSKKDSEPFKITDSITIYKEMRSSFIDNSTLQISGNKSRVGSISDEKIGLENIETLKQSLNGKSISGVDYRKIRIRPLLILHVLKIKKKDTENTYPENLQAVVAYGISFPGQSSGSRKINSVTYKVNTTWLKNNFDEEGEDDENEY